MGAVEGGMNRNDFHCWVEDKLGNVIFDPQNFSAYHDICRINKCDITKPVYHKWEDQEKYLKQHQVKMINIKDFYKRPKPLMCNYNAYAWAKHSGAEDPVVVIGSMGWLKNNGRGAWWEFG